MPKSISSVVADDGCEDDEDKMPGLEEEWIPPADDLAEQIAIWEAIQAANRWQSSDQEVDKDTSSANDPTPSWDRAGTASDKSSQVESSQVNAKPELSLEVLQTLQNFKFDFSFPKMENSPASSDLGGAHGEAAEESHACENDENEDSSPTEIINTEQEQEQGPVFHLFSQLPEAIRLTIWNLNNPEPRLIEIVEFKKNCRFYGNGRPVVNLQVCHESRIESLKSYPLSFSVDFEEPLIPFCFEKDTLLLGRRLLDEDTHIYFRKHCDLGDLKRVQRLVVDTALCWTTAAEELERAEKDRGSGLQLLRRDRGVGFGGLSRSIFSGVREYTALYNEDTDPLPEWAKLKWYPRIPIWPWQRINSVIWESQYQNITEVWHEYEFGDDPFWCEITPHWAEQARYGGVDKRKWDPAIERWEMPRMSSLGLDGELVDRFYESGYAPWPFLLVSRGIEDLFE